MTSPLDRAPEIARWLAATDIDTLELAGPGGRLLLRRSAGRVVEARMPDAQAERGAVTVASPGIGLLRRAHPLHAEPLAQEGATVAAGAILALLQVGALLVPVRAPSAGILAAAHREDGALIGFGDPLFDLWPAGDA